MSFQAFCCSDKHTLGLQVSTSSCCRKKVLIQVESWHWLWDRVLHLQPPVLKADLASASVLQHIDGNPYTAYERADVKSLEVHSPLTPQISGSHPSLFLNTGHHQSDSLDHSWVRQEQDPSDSPACRLPIQKAQELHGHSAGSADGNSLPPAAKAQLQHTPVPINSWLLDAGLERGAWQGSKSRPKQSLITQTWRNQITLACMADVIKIQAHLNPGHLHLLC